jgi:methylase of polypeptide subunit release factors
MTLSVDLHSSERTTPSQAVVWAVEELRRQGYPLRSAIDIGCGRGRNTLYLAQQGMQVTALDLMPNAIAALQADAAHHGLQDQIRTLTQDATEPWPIAPDSADLIIDFPRVGYKPSPLGGISL